MKLSDNNKKVLKLHCFRLAISAICLAVVSYVFITYTKGWFSSRSSGEISENIVRARGTSGVEFELYEWNSTSWTQIPDIDFTDSVPNEVRRYMLITSQSGLFNHFTFTVENFRAVEQGETAEDILDYIFVDVVKTEESRINPQTYIVDETLYPMYSYSNISTNEQLSSILDSESNSFSTDTASPACVIVFDIYVDKRVCNCYTYWGFDGTVSVS